MPLMQFFDRHSNIPPAVREFFSQAYASREDEKSEPAAFAAMVTLAGVMRLGYGMLTTAESNIKMGTAYFADLVKQFGGLHFALATYNAGPSRIAKWIAAKPGLERDEFIDDIPFPETQNYVKRILGTAEDYRRLYGPEGSDAADAIPAIAHPAASAAAAPATASATKKKAVPVKKKPAVRKKKAA